MIEFLPTPQKIKRLRKQLFMRQYELSSEHITTAFISMIELGKRGLRKDTAEKIAEKLNERAEKMGVPLNIDGAYLLCTPEEEAEQYCTKKLKEIKNIEETKEILEICKRYHVEGPESKAHQFIADTLFEEKKYEDAFVEYSYALDLCKNVDEKDRQAHIYYQSGLCKIYLERYAEALFLFNRANHYATLSNEKEISHRSLYDMALCYKNLSKSEAAIQYVEEFLKNCDCEKEFEKYISAKVLMANCYEANGDITRAIGVYEELVNSFPNLDSELLGRIYTSMGKSYMEAGKYIESLQYFNKAQKIRTEVDKSALADTLIEKSEVYIRQKLHNEAVLMIEMGLELANRYNLNDSRVKAYKALSKIYKELGDEEKLKEVYKQWMPLLNAKKDEKDLLNVANALALMYLNEGNIEASKECLAALKEILN